MQLVKNEQVNSEVNNKSILTFIINFSGAQRDPEKSIVEVNVDFIIDFMIDYTIDFGWLAGWLAGWWLGGWVAG